MTIDRIFFGYITLIGVLTGAALVAIPTAGDGWFKPYFWVLLAVAVFDGAVLLLRLRQPATSIVSMDAKLLGFVIGILLMVVIPMLAGSSARFY